MIAFTNWAFLNKEAENYYTKTGDLEPEHWNSGDILWHIDTICVKNIMQVMRWTKQYFTDLLGFNQPINYLRISDNGTIIRKSRKHTYGQS